MLDAVPSLRVLAFAVRRKVSRLLGQDRDPHNGIVHAWLSPSARHFEDYGNAPLALKFAETGSEGAASWQQRARVKLAELCGFARSDTLPVPIREDRFDLPGGLRRRRVYLQTRVGVVIPVHLIEYPSRPRPSGVMLCLQGSGTGTHLSWGEARFPADFDRKMWSYDFAVQAAERGYLAVAIEQSCFGERIERGISSASQAPCVDATMHALLLGRCLLGERCSDVSAVIDWLTAQSEELGLDRQRIHAMGHSAGGSVALFAAALDTRISAVLACGCVGSIRETIGRRRDNQGQNVIPGILNWMEMPDIIGLIAPRPFATVAGIDDPIWPASGGRAAVEEARTVYAQFGAGHLIDCVSEPGGHRFRPQPGWAAFESLLRQR